MFWGNGRRMGTGQLVCTPEGMEPRYEYTYRRQNWFASASEHLVIRENVGFFDMSSFGKFLVQGKDVEKVMNLTRNQVAVEPGKVVYTAWLNERGGFETDLTGDRLSEWEYLVTTAGASQMRDLAWLKRHTAQEDGVQVADVTSAYAVLSIMGPNLQGNSFRNSPMKI